MPYLPQSAAERGGANSNLPQSPRASLRRAPPERRRSAPKPPTISRNLPQSPAICDGAHRSELRCNSEQLGSSGVNQPEKGRFVWTAQRREQRRAKKISIVVLPLTAVSETRSKGRSFVVFAAHRSASCSGHDRSSAGQHLHTSVARRYARREARLHREASGWHCDAAACPTCGTAVRSTAAEPDAAQPQLCFRCTPQPAHRADSGCQRHLCRTCVCG